MRARVILWIGRITGVLALIPSTGRCDGAPVAAADDPPSGDASC